MALSFAGAALRAGVSRRSSAYENYRKSVEASPEVEPRADGRLRSAPGYAAPLPAGADPIQTFAARLPPSFAAMLQVIAAAYRPLTKDEIATAAKVSPTSSGLSRGLGELEALSLIVAQDGAYSIHPELRA
jgi:hypothetical protein